MSHANHKVTPVELSLRIPYRTAYHSEEVDCITAVFVRIETRQGQDAWGRAVFDPSLTGETREDVSRVQAVHRALPNLTLRLDADEGYTVQQALDVTRALESKLEMLEQPTPADDLEALRQVTKHNSVPILAAQSVTGPASALEIASRRAADGVSVKMAACGGLRCARQVDAIARAAKIATMVGSLVEPALLTAAGLSFALSSPNVRYGDLDGHFDLVNDPTVSGFLLEEGWLIATDVPGLGCTVEL